MDKKNLRSIIFRHLDGIAIAPVLVALQKKNIISQIAEQESMQLNEIVEKIPCNEGYLNVALRILASQGFLTYNVDNDTDVVTGKFVSLKDGYIEIKYNSGETFKVLDTQYLGRRIFTIKKLGYLVLFLQQPSVFFVVVILFIVSLTC